MRSIHRILVALPVLLFFAGCEKVISVHIPGAASQYVIEGVLNDKPGTCLVLVSKTKNFDEDNTFEGVAGAQVRITEEGGGATLLTETAAGQYEAASLTGSSGKRYTLEVITNGQFFHASSVMPVAVKPDSVYVTRDYILNGTRNLVNVRYQDPPQKGNNYRFVQYVNGLKERSIFIRDDANTNGNTIITKLRFGSDDGNEIKAGDVITIDMMCIDEAVYKYWYSLNRSATGSAQVATPANPVTNITGGALGYFSAQSTERRTIIAP
jgi:Domain of unknown function (DUF4249)